MMTPCIINVPVTIPHLQPSNIRRKGFRVPSVGPLGLVSAWSSALGYSTKCVVPAVTHSASGQGGSAVSEKERANGLDGEEESKLMEMLDYNVPTGTLFNALGVIRAYRLLQDGRELSEKENFLAYVLGWCAQWLAAKVFIIDDIKDSNFYTRRGQLCWHKLPQIGMIATNDASILLAHIFRILKKHFSEKPYYVQLLDLFNEIEFETVMGEMLDVTASSEKDMSKYTPELSLRIARSKGYGFVRIPVACALILAGEPLSEFCEAKDILSDITAYYQMENDYADCYGDPAVTGRIGTDIEDGKCTWLIVKALEHANEEEKKILYENFGNADSTCVAKVKQVYASLDLENMCKQYQKQRFDELKKSVEMHPSKAVQVLWAMTNNDSAINV